MANDRKQQGSNEVTFARDLGLFDATMIGMGAMIGAGIFVLTGIAAGEAGPASILSFALNGLVTLLTAFAYAELASAVPRAGGGYSFVRMAFPGAAGFIAGWMLWFAYTVACSLYALGFAGYFWEFFHKYIPQFTQVVFDLLGQDRSVLAVTSIIGLAFTWLNVRGAEVTGKTENILTMSKILILAIFITFGIIRIFDMPERAMESFFPFFPAGLGGVIIAMGLTFIAFEGYDLIATVAEEIKDPTKNIPRATFIALGVTVFIYLLILLVSLAAIDPAGMPAWEFLGKFKETAIVKAAENFMPAFGVAVIVFGGLLSTMSALNATVMAASRVAFSMSRDLWLPKRMSNIHIRRRTPHVAIVVTGVILLGMALTLPIEAVGSAASLIFLLTFAMVNLAVIVLRRKYPEIPRKYRVPLYPVIPVLGFLLNIFLALYQFKFQPIAWYVTIGWIAVGLLLYYAIFEKRAAAVEPQVLLPGVRPPGPDEEASVVVALHNPDNVEVLLDFAIPIARSRGIGLIAVSVVDVPRQMPIHEGMRFTHHKEPLLARAKKYASEKGIKIETDLVIAHRASDGLLTAVERHRGQALVMGWKGHTNARDRIFGEIADQIIRHAPCDLMLLKIGDKREFKSCLFPTAGGPHAQLAARVLNNLSKDLDLKVTTTHVVPQNPSAEQKQQAEKYIDFTLGFMQEASGVEKKLIESRSVAGGIARSSRDYDLVVIGAAREPLFQKILFGEIPERVARFSPTTVLVVKKYEGVVKSLLKKIFG
jgi:amino acid transporter/nucleotide-binding universal stress UspA family protein